MRAQATIEPAGESVFRILSIDGGGIRGVIPALLLERLETLLHEALGAAGEQQASAWRERGIAEPRIADCFHLIAGTSTGGLLTAALTVADAQGRPKLSCRDAVAIYESEGPAIFARPPLRRLLDPLGLLFPRYRLARLRKVLAREALLGQARLADACTEVLITSYDTTHTSPRLFTRWGVRHAGDVRPRPPGLSMVDVALATAAAPTYFDPARVEGADLVDGGVYAGNPALEAVSMALRRTDHPAPRVPGELLVISLGTGSWEQPLDYGWGGIAGWLRPRKGGEALLEAILNGQGDSATEAAHMILNGWSAPAGGAWWEPTVPTDLLGGGPRFWRYQPQLPEPWAMDDVGRIPDLEQIARRTARDYDDELRRLARLLVSRGPA